MKIVKVTWEDACGGDRWEDMEDVKLDDYIVETVGFLLKKTDKHIIVVNQVCHVHGKGNNFMKIPMGMVRKVKYLK